MEVKRRDFLKIAGVAALGLAAKPSIDVITSLPGRDAMPLEQALVGERWAMVINLRTCLEKEGCRDCVKACHEVHNVPDMADPKDEIKWIWDVPFEEAFPSQKHDYIQDDLRHSPVTVLCNHCDNPPCTRVCPTGATWKREDGIVMMDYHRCIGCRYCMAACPYGSRSFNWRDPRPFIEETDPVFPTRTKGVVEKCNFCVERLARGQLPACVESCEGKSLVFGDLADPNSEVRELLRGQYSIVRKPGLGTRPSVYYIL